MSGAGVPSHSPSLVPTHFLSFTLSLSPSLASSFSLPPFHLLSLSLHYSLPLSFTHSLPLTSPPSLSPSLTSSPSHPPCHHTSLTPTHSVSLSLTFSPLTPSLPRFTRATVAREIAINSAVERSAANASFSTSSRGKKPSSRQIYHPLFFNITYKAAEEK